MDGKGPDFIGIGAQRTGTSWIYACLVEHPEICMPRKEINFFSRERNWSRGFDWYERIFAECPPDALVGEFSTSYLTHAKTAMRIKSRYSGIRLVVSLRHPADRAYSSYLNDVAAGIVPATIPFAQALRSHPEYIEGGRYAPHLRRYLQLFPRDRIFVSIFDDARRDALATIGGLYRFLGVDAAFRPTMLDRPVGVGRIPRVQWMERALIDGAKAFRRRRALRPLWWTAKRIGAGDRLRAINTSPHQPDGLAAEQRAALIHDFEPDTADLEQILERPLPAWRR
jgi:Sulfotransferase domain